MLAADLCGVDLLADGSDWIRVHAYVTDARGTVCPFADDGVSFEVEGEAAIIDGPRIRADPRRAEAGICTILVRSTPRPGRIAVRANAFGLEPGEIALTSVPADRHALAARSEDRT